VARLTLLRNGWVYDEGRNARVLTAAAVARGGYRDIKENDMRKAFLAAVLVLFFSVPALAKSKDDYPVSCDVLWTAVKGALSNPGNYSLLGISDSGQNAAFLVVGERPAHTDRVALTTKDTGCSLKLDFVQIGSDDSNERIFRKQVTKSLQKIQAAKPAAEAPAPAKPAAAPGQP
jgi:hypothetical protein